MNVSELEVGRESLQRDFNLKGYVSIPDFVTGDELTELVSEKNRLLREVVPGMPPHQVFYEDTNDPTSLKQLQRLFDYDDYFDGLMFDSKFEKLAEILLEEPVTGKNMQYFNKPPGIGKPTPPHQDGFFFMLKPSHAITMWLALEDVSEEQGCVRYVEGSHQWGMRHHAKSSVLGFSQHILDFPQPNDLAHERAFPCKAGHLIAHHSLTIHWAGGNTTTDRTRQALGFIYYGQTAKEDTKAHEAYQQQLAREMSAIGKI